MAHTFEGLISNEYNPESGVNLVVKGLTEKLILRPQSDFDFDETSEKKKISLILRPSAGGTDGSKHQLKVEVTNGKENLKSTETHWELEIESSSTKPTNIDIKLLRNR